MTRTRGSLSPSTPPARAVQRLRAGAAALAGAVLGFFHLIPLAGEFVGHEFLVWVSPLAGALAAGAWAWHSAFGCRLIGVCTLLTAPLALFGLLLVPLVLARSPLAVTILLPIGVAGVGILALIAGSDSFDRLPGLRQRKSRAV
jgi:hypothetical protein